MNRRGRAIITGLAVLTGALLASVVMLKVNPTDSWAAFIGWVIFFVSIQSPLFLFPQLSCTAWLSRLWRRN
ncbi:MAG TPA: hypothetical protein VGW12_10385 [Pyrinomonadaceae bacterium]|nr:hypothetical protein [Pyrinomonadaceae bacterium]